jgi:ABC-type polysaccharide/polyol phosphate transport system ATPase subunit
MSSRVVEVQGLAKRYQLGEDFGHYRYLTLRESLAARFSRKGKSSPLAEIWALRDVSFLLDEGDVLGVIGRNGAGKSTLLKLLARITEPTAGVARTKGRVGALLDVGTGFHPELTGRENIYLNGTILGMSRRDIGRRFDEIVEFAGLARFLDTPLKRYSTGMNLRLAFAVAAHVEPPIVVVDEVLAVGDAEFQRRCLGKMSELTRAGRTVVFVSHDLRAIARLCPRVIWLDEGRVVRDGPPAVVIDEYLRSGLSGGTRAEFPSSGVRPVELRSVAITDAEGQELDLPRRDRAFSITVGFTTEEEIPNLDVIIWLLDPHGVAILNEPWSDSGREPAAARMPGHYQISLTVPPILAAGEYVVGVWIGSGEDTFIHDEALRWQLRPGPDDRSDERSRIVHPGSLEWRLERASADAASRTARQGSVRSGIRDER